MTLLNLRVPTQEFLLPTIQQTVSALAESLRFPRETCTALGNAVAQACRNAMQHGFDPGEQGEVELEVTQDGEQIVFSVRDKGLPFDPELLEDTGRGGVGSHALHEIADELRVKNLGPEGMCVELVKNLPIPTDHQVEQLPADAPQVSHENLEMRLLGPDDAVALTRCAYRTYGYSYAEEIYYPEMVAQGLAAGYLLSYGVVDPHGEVVASLSVLVDEPGAPVGELGIGMTDPRYRGHGYFEKLLSPVLEEAKKRGMLGLFAETVTIHTITQKGKHKHGWRETGVELAYIANRTFKAIDGNKPEDRQTILLFFVSVNPDPEQTVYLPEHHREMIGKIYEQNRLTRTFGQAAGAAPPEGPGQLEVNLQPKRSIANLQVIEWGQDTVDHVKAQLHDLKLRKVELVHLDLPLAQPATAGRCQAFEDMGFAFAGVVPNLWGTDVLRLQYLNNVAVDPDRIQVFSDFGKELLAYVLSSAARSGAVTPAAAK